MDTLCSRSTYTTYLCLSWLKQSLSMVIIVVLSEINFCGYSVVFCSKMVELHTLAWIEVTFIQLFMSIKLHFSVGPLWKSSPIFVSVADVSNRNSKLTLFSSLSPYASVQGVHWLCRCSPPTPDLFLLLPPAPKLYTPPVVFWLSRVQQLYSEI